MNSTHRLFGSLIFIFFCASVCAQTSEDLLGKWISGCIETSLGPPFDVPYWYIRTSEYKEDGTLKVCRHEYRDAACVIPQDTAFKCTTYNYVVGDPHGEGIKIDYFDGEEWRCYGLYKVNGNNLYQGPYCARQESERPLDLSSEPNYRQLHPDYLEN